MKRILSFLLALIILVRLSRGNPSMIVGPATSLLTMAWDEINPGSLTNKIGEISKQLVNMKTQLGKIEQAVIFGKDINTLEYLIDKYNHIDHNDQMQTEGWSETALEYSSDGFDKTIKSLEELMEGTSKIFAEGSIFATIAAKDKEDVCTDINVAFDYLTGLWITSHAVWAQAYKFKNNDYHTKAKELKERAESKIDDYEKVKEAAMPDKCYCFTEDMFYADLGHLTNSPETLSVNATSARDCQYKCNDDDECKVWTFLKKSFKCFKRNIDNNESEVGEEGMGAVVSGPKVCPNHYSFCCGLNYGLSIFITIIIVFIVLGCCCCCCCAAAH